MITIKSIAASAADHPGEYHLLYAIIILAVAYGAGYWQGTRKCSGESSIETRQLAGTLTKREQEIQAANVTIGKVQTDLQTADAIKAKLSTDNAKLAETANTLAHDYKLKVDQYAKLQADFNARIQGGHSGALDPSLVNSTTPECGKCKGQVDFGTYASCGWENYEALKASSGAGGFLHLKLGVRIQSVSLKQDPKDGALRAEISKAFLTADGRDIAEGVMNADSRVFTAPSLLGDMNRRHYYLYGGSTPRDAFLGLFTQRGTSPFFYGAQVNRPYVGGGYQPGVIVGWQIK